MILTYIIPLFALSFVVAFHELGHLFTAKLFKVKVETFSVGIGKKILKKNWKGTEYALSLIPLGGYCKLKGGDLQNPNKDKDSADMAKPFPKILIYMAGPLFNFILSIIIISIIYLLPVNQIIKPYVYPQTGQELPAELAGIKTGDKILSINGLPTTDFNDISTQINKENNSIIVLRNNKKITFSIIPKKIGDRYILGLNPYIPLTVLDTNLNSLKIGDKIVKVNNQKVSNLIDLINNLKEHDNDLELYRDNKSFNINIDKNELNQIEFTKKASYPIHKALNFGFNDTILYLKSITSFLGQLIHKGEMSKNISSPIRLIYDIGNSFSSSILREKFLFTLQKILITIASISLTLGFINLLPIPILDGGQILINFIILIKGSALKAKVLYIYQVIGLMIVLFLFILGFGNDILYIGDKLWKE